MNNQHIRLCERCGVPYDWRRSASRSLKMTYCGSLCERADLGFTIEALLTHSNVGKVVPYLVPAKRLAA